MQRQADINAFVTFRFRTSWEPVADYQSPQKARNPEISTESFKRAYASAILHLEPINITASVRCKITVSMQKIKRSAKNIFPETPMDLQRTVMELVKKEFD